MASRDIYSGPRTSFVFVEEDVEIWIMSFFYQAGSGFSGWPKDRDITLSKSGRDMRLEIQTFRNLGDRDLLNRDWLGHCC
jgi:hypothetical protein